MTILTRTAMLIPAGLIAGAVLAFPASAEKCAGRPAPVPGTLAAANNPCQPSARPKKDETARPDEKERANARSGGSGFYIGGSVGTDVQFRGR